MQWVSSSHQTRSSCKGSPRLSRRWRRCDWNRYLWRYINCTGRVWLGRPGILSQQDSSRTSKASCCWILYRGKTSVCCWFDGAGNQATNSGAYWFWHDESCLCRTSRSAVWRWRGSIHCWNLPRRAANQSRAEWNWRSLCKKRRKATPDGFGDDGNYGDDASRYRNQCRSNNLGTFPHWHFRSKLCHRSRPDETAHQVSIRKFAFHRFVYSQCWFTRKRRRTGILPLDTDGIADVVDALYWRFGCPSDWGLLWDTASTHRTNGRNCQRLEAESQTA